MKKILGMILFLLFVFLVAGEAWAQVSRLTYPVKELGYCRDAKECYLYCEIPENKAACWSYGEYTLGSQVLAEQTVSDDEMEAKIRELGIIFPIAELGGCRNVTECRAFCDNPTNQEICTAFARDHGIGQYEKHKEMLEVARSELGCDSFESCRTVCALPENRDRCMDLAERHAPTELRSRMLELRRRMQEILGCDSYSSCEAICRDPAKRDECMRFAEEHMPGEFRRRKLEILEEARDRLSCDSFESCRTYCEEHPDSCRAFAEDRGEIRIEIHEEGFTCRTDEECLRWCREHPDKCPGYKQSDDYEHFLREQEGLTGDKEEFELESETSAFPGLRDLLSPEGEKQEDSEVETFENLEQGSPGDMQ